MKKLITGLLLTLLISTVQLSAYTSSGYSMLRNIVKMNIDNQNTIKMYRLFVNTALNKVNSECIGTADDTPCIVHNEISFPITAEMDALDSANVLNVGDTITFTDGALTYTNFSSGKYNHSIKIAVNKIKMNGNFIPENSIEVFRWTDSGVDKAISLNGNDNYGTYNEKFAMTTINGKNTFIGSGKFVDTNTNDSYTYKAKLQQYDAANNGILIDMSSNVQIGILGTFLFDLIAKADNTGGYIKSTIKNNDTGDIYEEEETFDANKNQTGFKWRVNGGVWTTESVLNTGSYAVNDSDIESSVSVGIDAPNAPSAISVPYMVVESGATVNDSTVIGIGDFHDDNNDGAIQVNELHFDYFGDTSNLANSGALTDTDNLDIYDMSDMNNPVQVSGIFLTQ